MMPSDSPQPPEPAVRRRLAWVGLVGIVGAVAVLYWPAIGYPFVDLDDLYGVVENPGIRNLSWDGIRFLFLEDDRDIRWFPLAYLSFAVDHAFGGLAPAGFHRTNLLLHLANVALVFVLARRLSGDVLVAWVASALFGIHPLQVESVAWVSSRKNVLFFFFFLLSILTYLPHARRLARGEGWSIRHLAASLFLFLLSVSAKSTAVTLPAVLVLVDYYVARRPLHSPLEFVARSLPSKLLYVPVILLGWAMTRRLASRSPFLQEYAFDLFDWATITAHNLFFYVAKTLAPVGLAVFYPLPADGVGALPVAFYVFALAGLALLALGITSYHRYPTLVFGLGWYFATILPMALLPVFFSDLPLLAADRYFYQSSVGLFFVVGVGASRLWQSSREHGVIRRSAIVALGGVLAIACFARAWDQRGVWRDTRTLYQQTVRHQPSDAFFYRLAIVHANEGRMAMALRMLDDAENAPNQVFFTRLFGYQFRLADLYRRKGEVEKAASLMAAALDSAPNAFEPVDARSPLAYRYLAELYMRAGAFDRAAAANARARATPFQPRSYFESMWFLIAPAESKGFLEARVAEAPLDAIAWYYLGRWYELFEQPEHARDPLRRAAALGLDPTVSPR